MQPHNLVALHSNEVDLAVPVVQAELVVLVDRGLPRQGAQVALRALEDPARQQLEEMTLAAAALASL